LGGTPAEVTANVSALLAEVEAQRKELEGLRRRLSRAEMGRVLDQVCDVGGVNVLSTEVEASSMKTLREMSDWLRDQLGSAVIVLGAVMGGKPGFVAAVTPDLVDTGLRADRLVAEVAAVVGGSGGGRATLAQAGGRDAERIGEALSLVSELVANR